MIKAFLFWYAARLQRQLLARRPLAPFRPTLDDIQIARVIEFSYGDFAIFAVPDADVANVSALRAVCYRFHVERS